MRIDCTKILSTKTVSSLKKLTKELHQEIVSYLFPLPSISQSLAFRLAIPLIFAKTRFCSHINFIGRCLHSKVILKGFALIFMHCLFPILINIFAKFSVRKILFHVTLRGLLSELCAKNVTTSTNKFYNVALNCLKSVQLS